MSEQNRAERIAHLLQKFEDGEFDTDQAAESGEDLVLLQIAEQVKDIPQAVPEENWVRNARIRMLNTVSARAAEQQPPPAQAPNWEEKITWRLGQVLKGLVVVLVFLLIGGGFSFTTQNALPGDTLYPAKIMLEDLQLLTAPAAEDAILKSRFAGNRLTEIQLLVVQGRFDDVSQGVDAFETNVNEALIALAAVARDDDRSTYTVLLQIEANMRSYATNLKELRTLVPAPTRANLERAIAISQLLSLPSDS